MFCVYGQIGFVLFCGMGYIYIYLMIIETIQEVDATGVHGSIL